MCVGRSPEEEMFYIQEYLSSLLSLFIYLKTNKYYNHKIFLKKNQNRVYGIQKKRILLIISTQKSNK